MPRWRPLSSSPVGSRHLAPSDFVPGGAVLGCAAANRCGGDGVGPDGDFSFTFRVLCAKSSNLFVFSFISLVCLVFVTPPLNESF
jgi:hypothetical protein